MNGEQVRVLLGNTVISVSQVADLLDIAKGDLKFILMAGFRAGMRRGEISMARPQWFDLNSSRIHIPNPDPVPVRCGDILSPTQ